MQPEIAGVDQPRLLEDVNTGGGPHGGQALEDEAELVAVRLALDVAAVVAAPGNPVDVLADEPVGPLRATFRIRCHCHRRRQQRVHALLPVRILIVQMQLQPVPAPVIRIVTVVLDMRDDLLPLLIAEQPIETVISQRHVLQPVLVVIDHRVVLAAILQMVVHPERQHVEQALLRRLRVALIAGDEIG